VISSFSSSRSGVGTERCLTTTIFNGVKDDGTFDNDKDDNDDDDDDDDDGDDDNSGGVNNSGDVNDRDDVNDNGGAEEGERRVVSVVR